MSSIATDNKKMGWNQHIVSWMFQSMGVIVASCCAITSIILTMTTFQTYWQIAECGYCSKWLRKTRCLSMLSIDFSENQYTIVKISNTIKPVFRILTSILTIAYTFVVIAVAIGAVILQVCVIAVATHHNVGFDTKHLWDSLEAGTMITGYSVFLWVFMKFLLYFLLLARLWYLFDTTMPKVKIFVAFYVILLLIQASVVTFWFIEGLTRPILFDVLWCVYCGVDIIIIFSYLITFYRQITILATELSIETLKDAKIDYIDAQYTDLIELDKKEKKLLFEATRVVILSSVSMITTLIFGVLISVVRAELFFVGCNVECTHNLWCIYTLLVAIDSVVNLICIHLNSGYQKKNYTICCAFAHNFCLEFVERRTKVNIVQNMQLYVAPSLQTQEIETDQ